MQPKVTIIVPCYKVEKYIDRCLSTLINQTMRDIEIILVDDASPDNTPQKCDEWEKTDSRIKVIHKEKNEGLGYARNTGMEKATGEYIAFLDSDDYVDTKMYGNLYKIAKNSNNPQAVFCGVNQVNDKGDTYLVHRDYPVLTEINSQAECRKIGIDIVSSRWKSYRAKHFLSVWHGIYNFSFLKDNNIKFCSERNLISEDVIFDIDFMAVAYHIVYVPECYNYYCDNGTSLSKSFRKDRFERNVVMWKELIRRLRCLGYEDKAIYSAHKYIIGCARNSIYSYFKHIDDTKERFQLISNIVNRRDIWNIALTNNVINILPRTILPFYYFLQLNSPFMVYCYGWLKNHGIGKRR